MVIVMNELQVLATQALWYAWGRIDSGAPETAGMDSDTAFAFREWYGAAARRYAAGEVGFRPAIRHAWDDWSKAGRVELLPVIRVGLVGKVA